VLFRSGSTLSFESWSGNTPTGWTTTNLPNVAENVKKSSDAQHGSYAARCDVLSFSGTALNGSLTTGTITEPYIAIAEKISKVTFYYKLSAQASGDGIGVLVFLYKGTGNLIGSGIVNINQATSSYTMAEVPITYTTNETPDLIGISFASSASTAGSYFIVDNVSWE